MLKIKKINCALVSVISIMSSLLTAKCIQDTKSVKESEAVYKSGEIFGNEQLQSTEKSFSKGAWISFMDLDVHQYDNKEEAFKKMYSGYIEKAKEHNLDYIVVHVRSHSDAFYPSKIFPWSHIFTGIQGDSQNFDPLQYAVDEAHKNGLKFHAWVNPLRISFESTPKQICEANPYNSEPYKSKVIDYKNGKIANPAYHEVRKLIVDGIKEVVENYDVDAIHLDDYFYPEEDTSSTDFAYQEYLSKCIDESPMSAEQWRIYNINLLVKEISEAIKSLKPNVEFGISPPGVLEKCKKLGADISEWVTKGYVDYICPQIYWSIDFTVMPFEDTLKKWIDITRGTQVKKVYVGLAAYKAGSEDADAKTWSKSNDILATEYDIVKRHSLDGITLFSLKCMDEPQRATEIFNLDKKLKDV